MSSQNAENRRWNPSYGIAFQRPSQLQRSTWNPACNLSTSSTDPSEISSDCITQSDSYRSPSTYPTDNSDLNLQPSEKLSYPDLSLSSLTTTHEDSFYSLPNSARPTSRDENARVKTTESVSTTPDRRADTYSVPDEPFRSPRGFHIPKAKFQNALDSKASSAASYWQYTLYRGPNGEKDKVKLHYCKNKEATEAVSQLFINEEVIGFDIEWSAQAKSTDGIKKNVSLVQIACEERIALFHIARYPNSDNVDDLVAPTFKQIMESREITKVGVAIKGDCTRLKNFLGIHCQGLFELSYLHKLVNYCSGNIAKVDRRYVRLADQVQEHLRLPLLKGDIQTSDWGRDLDYQQTHYAASDSYAGLQLFHVLEAKRQSFNPIPPRPAHAELNLAISLGDQLRLKQPVEFLDDGNESSDAESVSSSDISVEELAREYFHVSLDDINQVKPRLGKRPATTFSKEQSSGTTPILSTLHSSTAFMVEELPKKVISSPELELANQFVTTFSQPPNKRIAPQALRAYSLWHEQGLSVPKVAAILRQPPIQDRTVITYLCDAISIGNLKCEPTKILRFASEYSYQPFIKAHKDLFERARKEVWKAETVEARRASKEDSSSQS